MEVNKKIDLDFIKSFSRITITHICKDLKVDRTNLMKGNSSSETTRKIRNELEKRLNELLNEKN